MWHETSVLTKCPDWPLCRRLILYIHLPLSPPDAYSEMVPVDGPPSFRGQAVKYVYKLTIGCQRVNSPIKLLRVPFRVLVLQGEGPATYRVTR